MGVHGLLLLGVICGVFLSRFFAGLLLTTEAVGGGLRQDARALMGFKGDIRNDPSGFLRSWGEEGNPCRWTGVQCERVVSSRPGRAAGVHEEVVKAEDRVVSLELWGLELEGTISSQIGSLSELRKLVIVGNKFTGGHIPDEIRKCRKLSTLDLRANKLSGDIGFSLADLLFLEVLNLSENKLTGTLRSLFAIGGNWLNPPVAYSRISKRGICPRLNVLALAQNAFSGEIPEDIGSCSQLEKVILNDNKFRGSIPSSLAASSHLRVLLLNGNFLGGNLPAAIPASCKKLQILSVADNILSGKIPDEFAELEDVQKLDFSNNILEGRLPLGKWKVQEMALAGSFLLNSGLCGWPLTQECVIARHGAVDNHASRVSSIVSRCGRLAVKAYSHMENIIMDLMRLRQRGSAQLAILAFRTRRFMEESSTSTATSPSLSPVPSSSHRRNHSIKRWSYGLAIGTVAGALFSICLAAVFRMCFFYVRKVPYIQGPIIFHPNIAPKMLVFLEKDGSLREEQVVGLGGAGRVYRALLENGMSVAVKRVLVKEDQQGLFGQRQIRAELETLGRIRHRNLALLLAYVHRPDCHLLLYEYMENGSLHHTLQKVDTGELKLPWPIRHKIAVGTIQGLSYLHFHSDPKIVHRDLKPSNILLDSSFRAHVSDFGLAKVVPGGHTHVSTGVAGTVGYIAPEYSQTCRFTDKSDVYSFGVVLAVLLTGKDPTAQFFQTVPGGSMGNWLHDLLQRGEIKDAIDPNLNDAEFLDEILLAMKISVFCTNANPSERPTSKEVLIMLNQIRPEEP